MSTFDSTPPLGAVVLCRCSLNLHQPASPDYIQLYSPLLVVKSKSIKKIKQTTKVMTKKSNTVLLIIQQLNDKYCWYTSLPTRHATTTDNVNTDCTRPTHDWATHTSTDWSDPLVGTETYRRKHQAALPKLMVKLETIIPASNLAVLTKASGTTAKKNTEDQSNYSWIQVKFRPTQQAVQMTTIIQYLYSASKSWDTEALVASAMLWLNKLVLRCRLKACEVRQALSQF